MDKFADVKQPLQDNRYFGALFLLPIFLAFILGGIWLKVVVAIMGLRAMYEFFTVIKVKGLKPIESVGYMGGSFLFGLFIFGYGDLKILSVMVLLVTVTAMIVSVFQRQYHFVDAAVTIMGFLYTIVFFALILLIYEMAGGRYYILTIFTIAWICDTTAYFTGRFFGKRKLIPAVSPKKTVEGALGGLVGGALATMLFGLALSYTGRNVMHPLHFLAMGFIGSFFSQIGDLIASSIKRDAGVKDYPKLIPGHGGILDRFDSVLLAAVSVFLYLTIFIG